MYGMEVRPVKHDEATLVRSQVETVPTCTDLARYVVLVAAAFAEANNGVRFASRPDCRLQNSAGIPGCEHAQHEMDESGKCSSGPWSSLLPTGIGRPADWSSWNVKCRSYSWIIRLSDDPSQQLVILQWKLFPTGG